MAAWQPVARGFDGRAVLRIPAAALLGLASAMRTFTPAAVLILRGRPAIAGTARRAILTAAIGEILADKNPAAPARTDPPALAARVLSGALCGWRAAGVTGAVIGATSSGASTFATHRARAALASRTGLPDPLVALCEDALAIGVAGLAAQLLELASDDVYLFGEEG